MKQYSILALVTLGMLASGSALAYQAGDFIVRAGVASVQPNEDSGNLKLDGTTLPGTKAGVDNDEQLGLSFTYMVTSNWGVGLLAATPFEHDIKAKGLGVDAGSIKHLPPTLTVQYYPMEIASRWQPYVGLGVNYTMFFDESVDGQLESLFGPGKLSLNSSWGWAGQLGLDYLLDDRWLLSASIWYIDIDTDASFKFADNRVTAKVDIDPWVYMLGVGYRF